MERDDRPMEGRNGAREVRTSPYRGSISGQIFKGLHQKLSELQEERKAIIERSGDAIFVVHPVSGEIYEANGRAASMTGWPVSELQGMNFEQLIPEQEILLKTIEFNSLNGNGGTTATLRRKDGASRNISMSACSIHREQKTLRLVFIRKLSKDDLLRLKSHTKDFAEENPAEAGEDAPEPIYGFPNIIGKSKQIRRICQLIGQVAKTESTVLIQGESGTGKEIAAQAIHYHSLRSKEPFVKVNCAALTETLLESELFGHVKGAFTGAIQDHKGRFKEADGGSILLDEIGCMSLSGQAKLLRVLEEREFEPVGSSVTTSVDVRVIAASKINLQQAVAEGRFREDLYYRLNVFTIRMASVREKKEDIPLLIQHFLKKYSLAIGKEIRELTPETMDLMMRYDWPGNVRELKNAIEHAVIVARCSVILPSDLPSNLFIPGGAEEKPDFSEESGLRDKLNFLEKQIIQDVLKRTNGVKKEAASILKIDPRNFSYLLRKHNLV